MRWIFGLLCALTALCPFSAEGLFAASEAAPPPLDRWHHVTPGSPFYSADSPQLRIAAIQQSDGLFARIILGDDDQGAYVTIGVPGLYPATQLRSELIYSNGAKMSRTVTSAALDTLAMPGSETMIYSFAVAAEDIRAFRKAARWVVRVEGQDPVTITLDGSSKAIQTALDADPVTPPPADTPSEGRQMPDMPGSKLFALPPAAAQ